MGRLAKSISAAVKDRWPAILFGAVGANAEIAALARRRVGSSRLDYRGSLNEAELSRYLVEHDRSGRSNAREWAANINKWLSKTTAPTPEMVRITLAALGSDWIVGLGECGYQQHATCLLHELWKAGKHSLARDTASSIFSNEFDNPEIRQCSLTNVASLHFQMDALVKSAWPKHSGEVPTHADAPRDLAASPGLYTAWLVFESTRASRSQITAWHLVKNEAAKHVCSWAKDLTPRAKELVLK